LRLTKSQKPVVHKMTSISAYLVMDKR